MNQQTLSTSEVDALLAGIAVDDEPAAPDNTRGEGTETDQRWLDRLIASSTVGWHGAHNNGR